MGMPTCPELVLWFSRVKIALRLTKIVVPYIKDKIKQMLMRFGKEQQLGYFWGWWTHLEIERVKKQLEGSRVKNIETRKGSGSSAVHILGLRGSGRGGFAYLGLFLVIIITWWNCGNDMQGQRKLCILVGTGGMYIVIKYALIQVHLYRKFKWGDHIIYGPNVSVLRVN